MDTIIAQIKEKVDLLELANFYNLAPKKTGKTFKCKCPFHSEKTPSFSINLDKGYYHCFGCGWGGDAIELVCQIDNLDFKEAINKLAQQYGLDNSNLTIKTTKKQAKKILKPVVYPNIALGFESASYHIPGEIISNENFTKITRYSYSFIPKNNVWKEKIEFFNGKGQRISKTFSWKHQKDGKTLLGKGEHCKSYYGMLRATDKNIFIVEGEKDVDTLAQLNYCAISFNSSDYSELLKLENKNIGFIYIGDNDKPGKEKAQKFKLFCQENELACYSTTINELWQDAPDKADISDYLEKGLGLNDLIKIITLDIKKKMETIEILETIETTEEYPPDGKQNYTQLAFDALYLDKNYISIEEELYKFNGSFYEKCNVNFELKRIAKWAAGHSYKLTEKAKLKNILDWAIINVAVNPDKVNPKGINLKNGILTINWDKETKEGTIELIPHDPSNIYTYCSDVAYNPKANDKDCLKLLECLDPPERKIFLRAIASSFDMQYLRKNLGRMRALMLEGKGSNGKDTLGAVVSTIFGHAMVNCSFGDFAQYDQGRKFPLAKLNNALISWSSENSSLSNLDSVQSLKAAITGDSLCCEQKNKDEFQFNPKALFIFNCNEPPQIKTGLEAISSRWAILRFTKTYKMNPNKKLGELKADPRFKEDPNFIKEKIAPAFLNLLIAEIKDLASNGINYDPIKESFESLKRESSHLFQFCDDMGIVEDPDGKIYINDLWELLKNWYIDQGILEIEYSDKGKEKLTWHDQVNRYDKNVKASNQVYARFGELFPNISRIKETRELEKMGYFYLGGIAQIASVASGSLYEGNTASVTASVTDAIPDAVTLTNQQPDATDAIKPILLKNLNEQQKFSLFKELINEYGIIPFNVLISISDHQLARIGRSVKDAQNDLIARYGKKSRQLLEDHELIDYLDYLAKI
jgi:putative DNA primase/helicase